MRTFPWTDLYGGWHLPCAMMIVAIHAAFAPRCFADSQVYTAEVVTDVALGGIFYHNAEVTITFLGDTSNIEVVTGATGQPVQSMRCPAGYQDTGQPVFYWLPQGHSQVLIATHGKTVRAKFLDQLFVGVDRCAGGIGIGSFSPDGGFEPAYPLSFTNGDVRHYTENCGGASCLAGTLYGSGSAFSCVGFLESCKAPYPLQTDHGDLLIYMPYQDLVSPNYWRVGSLNRGFFSMQPGSPPIDHEGVDP